MTLLVAQLDDQAAAHLRRALEAHRLWCRANGIPEPPALAQLSLLASTGQDRTKDPAVDPFSDTAPMVIVLTFQEAAEALRVSERGVRRLVDAGELNAITIGGRRRIHRDDLADFATRRRSASQACAGDVPPRRHAPPAAAAGVGSSPAAAAPTTTQGVTP